MYLPDRYFAGLSKKARRTRKREIAFYGKKSFKDPAAYVGFKTDKGVSTRKSSYTARFQKLFPKAKTLKQKAVATGVPLTYLQKSYDRGLAAWRTGHRPGATQQQWGYARVHSFLTCGKTYRTTDSDLARAATTASPKAKHWFKSQCGPLRN
jgi:hypothetical protein